MHRTCFLLLGRFSSATLLSAFMFLFPFEETPQRAVTIVPSMITNNRESPVAQCALFRDLDLKPLKGVCTVNTCCSVLTVWRLVLDDDDRKNPLEECSGANMYQHCPLMMGGLGGGIGVVSWLKTREALTPPRS